MGGDTNKGASAVRTRGNLAASADSARKGVGRSRRACPRIQQIRVDRIRPEKGLGRQRDREGHRELRDSIAKFGVLTPVTVRPAPDGSNDFLLIKGQGRTLACRLLGIAQIPAIVVDQRFAETQKVQQFLVENVARLRMRPIDRALLISHGRGQGEETADLANRFGISPVTVRRLEAQLDGATSGEVAALRAGDVSLALHSVIARHIRAAEREDVIRAVSGSGIKANELQSLLVAVGWAQLAELGDKHRARRLALIDWACSVLATLPRGDSRDRLRQLAMKFPTRLEVRTTRREAR